MDLQEKLDRLTREYLKGLQAEECSEYLSGLFEEMRQMLYEEWKTVKIEDYQEIKNLLLTIDRMEGLINSHIQNGKIAKREIEEIEK